MQLARRRTRDTALSAQPPSRAAGTTAYQRARTTARRNRNEPLTSQAASRPTQGPQAEPATTHVVSCTEWQPTSGTFTLLDSFSRSCLGSLCTCRERFSSSSAAAVHETSAGHCRRALKTGRCTSDIPRNTCCFSRIRICSANRSLSCFSRVSEANLGKVLTSYSQAGVRHCGWLRGRDTLKVPWRLLPTLPVGSTMALYRPTAVQS